MKRPAGKDEGGRDRMKQNQFEKAVTLGLIPDWAQAIYNGKGVGVRESKTALVEKMIVRKADLI